MSKPADPGKAARRADQATLMAYHEARLAELLEHVRQGFADYDAGGLDAFDLDSIIHQYTGGARELWKFCAIGGAEVAIRLGMLELWKYALEADWWE